MSRPPLNTSAGYVIHLAAICLGALLFLASNTSKQLWSLRRQIYCDAELCCAAHSCSSCLFSFTLAHSSASGGAGLRSMSGCHFAESSRFFAMNSCCASGTSSSAKIASTGHSGTHSVQPVPSSGTDKGNLGPSRKQSTGQTSTQSVYLHLMQDSVTT